MDEPLSRKGFVVSEAVEMKCALAIVGFTLLVVAVQVGADMAAWYRWESQADGRLVCSQVSPGEGWRRFSGPFNNGACRDN
nr:hypothetical protein [Pseudomonas sp. PS01300]